jgi:hypothetical protein
MRRNTSRQTARALIRPTTYKIPRLTARSRSGGHSPPIAPKASGLPLDAARSSPRRGESGRVDVSPASLAGPAT